MASRQIDRSLAPRPPASPETALWLAVLQQARRDLESNDPSTGKSEASGVVRWVDSRDFERVCWNAGVNAEETRSLFRELIERTKAND